MAEEDRRPSRAETWCDTAAEACAEATLDSLAAMDVAAGGVMVIVGTLPEPGSPGVEAVAIKRTISDTTQLDDVAGERAACAVSDALVLAALRAAMGTHHGLALTAAIGELERGITEENIAAAGEALTNGRRTVQAVRS